MTIATLLEQFSWQNVLDASTDLIAILDDAHKVIWANKAMLDLLKLSLKDVVGVFCYEIMHETFAPPKFCPFAKFQEDGKAHETIIFLPKFKGNFLVAVSPILNENEEVIGSLHVAKNITEYTKAYKALELSEVKFAAIFNHSPIAMCISQVSSSLILDVNEEWLELTGYTKEEVVGKTVKELNSYVNIEDRDRLIAELDGKDYVNDFNLTFRIKNGDIIHGDMSVSTIIIDGIRCWITAYVDKTQQVTMERAIRNFETTMLREARDGLVLSLRNGTFVKE